MAKALLLLLLIASAIATVHSQTVISLAFFIPRSDYGEFAGLVRYVFTSIERNHTDFQYNIRPINISRDDDMDAVQQFCQAMSTGLNAVVDMTWGGWVMGRTKAELAGIPYIRVDTTIRQFVMATDHYLRSHDAADAALIFQNEDELDQSLYYIIGNSIIRVIVLNRLQGNSTNSLKRMRPTPSYYVIFADTKSMADIFSSAISGGLTTRDSNWNLVFTDFGYQNVIQQIQMSTTISVIIPNDALCCYVQGKKRDCSCDIDIRYQAVNISLRAIGVTFVRMTKQTGLDPAVTITCDALPETAELVSNASNHKLLTMLSAELRENWPNMMLENKLIYPEMSFDVLAVNNTFSERIGRWRTQDGYESLGNYKQATIKRFFRVGTVKARPWVYQEGTDSKGQPKYDGYCIRLLQKLAHMMQFDYELVFPKDGYYGSRQEDGSWNGLVADLAAGETDIIVAALTMTSEREEVIDFVAPYFDQSGISIVIRKPEQELSLFKFMTVLKLEVWLSIVGALLITGFTIWLLDKFSPYSSANNKELYPYACREFTLKESLWFALTSFTPQGGGEAPKALSGRTLVAAYWLFVVLMLATFTANLAAFLTVERMQTSVGSMQELAQQSKINYTVVAHSTYEQYFSNMAAAEDELYRVWKEMTLNSTGGDQSKFRVWDYPIKEQYSNILATIRKTGPVLTAEEGFDRVLESKQGLFAFIHDASEIRYEVYNNCNLTEVGEPFAEQPYAIAVQQGSHLQEEISKKILDLQRDRYFETLNGIFFNSTKRNFCPNSGEDEGITLESLGGVFIATVIGLVISMLTLAGEVVYYRRQNTTQVHTMGHHLQQDPQQKMADKAGIPRVSLINVNPKEH